MRGPAKLVAWSVVRAPINPEFKAPYAPALVSLDCEPHVRLVTQIVECDFADLRCDMPLELCFRMLEPIKRAPFPRAGVSSRAVMPFGCARPFAQNSPARWCGMCYRQ